MALLADEFSDRVGFMTMLISWDSDRDDALAITESVNASFITVDAMNDELEPILDMFTSGFIPETVLIDEDGNVIESIVGGNADEYSLAIERALKS